MFHRRFHDLIKEGKEMAVVLPQAIIERSIRVRQLLDDIQMDAQELKELVEQEHREPKTND